MKNHHGLNNNPDISKGTDNQTHKKTDYLKVIGVGLSRTGTLSLKKALEILNYDKCYHGFICENENHWDFWSDALEKKKKGEKIDFQKLFQGQYKATMDMPCNLFYEELLEANPEAKLILTVRGSADAWYYSMLNTIFIMIDPRYRNWVVFLITNYLYKYWIAYKTAKEIIHSNLNTDVSDPTIYQKDKAIEAYNRHIKTLVSKFGKDKMLIFNCEEGWEPLCRFLGCKIPKEEFPKVNKKSENLGFYMVFFKYGNWITVIIVVILALYLAYY